MAQATQNMDSSKFRYTLDNNFLSHEQREFYEENGYIVVKDLLPQPLINLWRDCFVDLCEGRREKGMMTLMKEMSLLKSGLTGESLVYKLQDFVWDEDFFQYCSYPKLMKYVECFTGPNTMAVHTMLINKPPDSGAKSTRHPLHQDLYYFPFRPADRIVCSWTAMEKCTKENGCLIVLPGTHKGELLPHGYPPTETGAVNKAFHGVFGYENVPVTHLEMDVGDTVLFHPILLHGSGINTTKGFRKSISCHYAASECDYIEVKGTIQESIADEVKEIAAKKGLNDITYVDVWKARARLVKGASCNL